MDICIVVRTGRKSKFYKTIILIIDMHDLSRRESVEEG